VAVRALRGEDGQARHCREDVGAYWQLVGRSGHMCSSPSSFVREGSMSAEAVFGGPCALALALW